MRDVMLMRGLAFGVWSLEFLGVWLTRIHLQGWILFLYSVVGTYAGDEPRAPGWSLPFEPWASFKWHRIMDETDSFLRICLIILKYQRLKGLKKTFSASASLSGRPNTKKNAQTRVHYELKRACIIKIMPDRMTKQTSHPRDLCPWNAPPNSVLIESNLKIYKATTSHRTAVVLSNEIHLYSRNPLWTDCPEWRHLYLICW